jgi:hypothetical protein
MVTWTGSVLTTPEPSGAETSTLIVYCPAARLFEVFRSNWKVSVVAL